MRHLKIIIISLLLLSVLSCGEEISRLENELEETQAKLDAAEKKITEYEIQLEEINSNIDNAEAAVSTLESEVNNFGIEEWEYNVPDVERETSNVASAIEEIRTAANN